MDTWLHSYILTNRKEHQSVDQSKSIGLLSLWIVSSKESINGNTVQQNTHKAKCQIKQFWFFLHITKCYYHWVYDMFMTWRNEADFIVIVNLL